MIELSLLYSILASPLKYVLAAMSYEKFKNSFGKLFQNGDIIVSLTDSHSNCAEALLFGKQPTVDEDVVNMPLSSPVYTLC